MALAAGSSVTHFDPSTSSFPHHVTSSCIAMFTTAVVQNCRIFLESDPAVSSCAMNCITTPVSQKIENNLKLRFDFVCAMSDQRADVQFVEK
jgi:hypothetical protein